ncbi:MAG: FUSC family protein, partial [Candidatus Binataceae bacterium]
VGVFTALSTYLIVTRNLGSFGLMIQVVMLDSFYGVIFAPADTGWAAASLLGGSVIAFGVIALFDGWLWPDPAERILLQSLAASALRMRARLLETTQYYLGERVSRPPEPPVSSEMQTQLGLLERARAEGVTSHRHAVLLAAISRGARMHNIIDGVIVAAREEVPREIRTSVRAELRAAADAIGAALDEMAAELPTLIRTGPDEPPPPLAARINPALAAMDARILAERPHYIPRAGAAELANLGAFIDGLHRVARLLERPLDAPPAHPGVARTIAPASAPDPQMVRYCAKVALCLLAGYVLGLTTQQPAMSVILTTVIVTALPTYGASLRKMTLRIIGGVIGGIVAIGAIIVVTPNFSTLPSYMLVLFVVLFASAYASLASGRIAYAGKQIGTTFVLIFAGLRPSLAIYEPLWRAWGILLGTLIVTVVFFVLWPEYAGDSLMPRLCKVINDTLAAAPGGAAANTIEIHNASAEITRLLAEILRVADDARLEGRNSLINYDAVVQSAGTGRRIAHRLAALTLQRIENPLPPLDAETQAACDRTIAAIRQRLEEWLAFLALPT